MLGKTLRVNDLAAANTFEIRIRQSSGNRSIGYRITGQKLPVWQKKDLQSHILVLLRKFDRVSGKPPLVYFSPIWLHP
jgi:hypothetical protein